MLQKEIASINAKGFLYETKNETNKWNEKQI